MKQCYGRNILVKGKVQGVFFRKSAQEKARELGVNGFARNLQDGSVHIIAEGAEEKLDEFVTWCRQGPSASRVDDLEVNKIDCSGFENFVIRH